MLAEPLERRASADIGAAGRRVTGYAIVFNELSEDLGGFREIIEPSAVDRTFREHVDVRALANHDPAQVLGRVSAGTLQLEKDGHGLKVSIDLPKTSVGNDLLELVSRRDVNGMSFTFAVVRPDGERFERRAEGPVRVVSDMRVHEVSIVTFPAYQQTDVQVARRSFLSSMPSGQSIAWLRQWAKAQGHLVE